MNSNLLLLLIVWNLFDSKSRENQFLLGIDWLERAIWKKVKNNARDRGYYDKIDKAKIEEEKWIKLHIPKRWKKNKEEILEEKKPIFRKYQRYRSGWEWKISLLKRKYWLSRLRVRRDFSIKNSTWWAIVVENMRILVNNAY